MDFQHEKMDRPFPKMAWNVHFEGELSADGISREWGFFQSLALFSVDDKK